MAATLSTLDGLLPAVLRDPADDAARLIVADALEEAGQAERAEFIRVEIAMARFGVANALTAGELNTPGNRAHALARRRHELLNRNLGPWTRAADCATARGRFRRGFIEVISLPTADFLRRARALFGAHPITDVELPDREPDQDPGSPYEEWDAPNRQWVGRPAACYWWKGGPGRAGPSYVPTALVRHWPRVRHLPRPWHDHWVDYLGYRDARAARADLSAAAVAYGRAQAGLPPLPGTRTGLA